MANMLTAEELSKFRDAFNTWDTGEGTIPAPDVFKAIELLGDTPSVELQAMFDHPDAHDQLISFDEFVAFVLGWCTSGHDQKDLLDVIAEVDDGDGRVQLRDFLRIVHEHMEEGGSLYTVSELFDLYRQAFDASLFEAAGGSLEEDTWKVFEEEFADFFGEQDTTYAHSPTVKNVAADDSESKCEPADMLKVTVTDLHGNPLLCDAFASTWSVGALHQQIEAALGVPVHRQALLLAKEDGLTHRLRPRGACLSESGVLDGSTVLLIVRAEMKLDYKEFMARLFDAEMNHSSTA